MSLFGINYGVICQQCNCKGAYGAGLSGAISSQYPIVLKDFEDDYRNRKGRQFGTYRIIAIDSYKKSFNEIRPLMVANIYSQNDYGNSEKTGIVYTDIDKLVACIKDICEKYSNSPVYVPHAINANGKHGGIGCGLAGEKWKNLYPRLVALNQSNLYTLDTYTGITGKI